MLTGHFLIGEYNNNIYNINTTKLKLECKNNKNINFKYLVEINNQYLTFSFKDINIPRNGNYLIYIRIYYYNEYNEFKYPYSPISIRFLDNDILIYNRFTIDRSKNKYIFNNEVHMPYQKDSTIQKKNIDQNNFELKINMKDFGIRNKMNDRIGYSIELVEIINNDDIRICDRTNDIDDFPIILPINSVIV